MATTARIRLASRRSTPRSRPLLRPPATSTTESKPARAARAAWGLVAFESSTKVTPPLWPTGVTRWGSPENEASTERRASSPTPRSPAAAAAARALAMSCGPDRRRSAAAMRTEPSGRWRVPPSSCHAPLPAPPPERFTHRKRGFSARASPATPRAKATERAGAAAATPATAASSALKTRRSSPDWLAKMRALAATYSVKVGCQSRWSSATLSSTATLGRNRSVKRSWKDDTSATTTSTASSWTASSSGRPMLPAATDRTPPAASISTIRVVTVVFPSSSISERSGTPARSASP